MEERKDFGEFGLYMSCAQYLGTHDAKMTSKDSKSERT
jgi:hypothetical protein